MRAFGSGRKRRARRRLVNRRAFMTIRAVPARGLLLFVLVLAKPVLGVEPALPPTPADVFDWSRLLDAAPPSPGGDGPLLARSLGRTAYAALVHGRPGLAEAAFRKAGANSREVKAEEADLYFAAAEDLYDDCRWWWRGAPFVLLYLDIAAKKGSRRMARIDELVRVMRADLAGIEDSWVFPEDSSSSRGDCGSRIPLRSFSVRPRSFSRELST
jgi:hypothetical protein